MALNRAFILSGNRADIIIDKLSRSAGCHFYYTKKGPEGMLAAAFNSTRNDEPLSYDDLERLVANNNGPEIIVSTDGEYRKLLNISYAYVRT